MELWTYEHAITLPPAVAVMIIIAIVLKVTIGSKSLRIRMIPFQILSVIIFALEIGKQALSFARGYDLYHIPLHFCSIFIFMFPIMAFYNGKHRQFVTGVTTALSSAVTLITLVYPSLIYSGGNIREFFSDYFSFHTVLFHNIVIFQFILIVALRLHSPEWKRDSKNSILFILGYCAIAAPASYILKTNYNNFYHCNIPILESVRLSVQNSLGTVPAQLLYIAILVAVDVVFIFIAYWLYRLLNLIFNRKTDCEKTA